MAKAKVTTRYGVIRPDGSWAIEPKFAHAGIYSDERLPISDDGKTWGFAAASGETAIAPRFTFAFNFLSGAASVETARDAWDVIDRDGNSLALWRGATRDGRIRCSTGRSARSPAPTFEPSLGPETKWGMLDEQGAIVVEPSYSYVGDVVEGLVAAWSLDGKTVYLDRDGKVALGPFDGHGRAFSSGWARLLAAGGWYFIDRTGAVVLQTEYPRMEPFREDRAVIEVNQLYGMIDRSGAVVVPPRYAKARSFADGMAAVATLADPANPRSERWGFVDASGAEVIAPAFVRVTDFSGGVAAAAVFPEGKSFTLWGLVDRSGAWIVEPQYAEIGQLAGGVAKVVHSAPTTSGRGKEGLIDASGKLLADGYTFVDPSRGFPAAVNKSGRQTTDGSIKGGTWGFIDATGAEIIECRFASLGSTFGAGFGFATVGVSEVVVPKLRAKKQAPESPPPETPPETETREPEIVPDATPDDVATDVAPEPTDDNTVEESSVAELELEPGKDGVDV